MDVIPVFQSELKALPTIKPPEMVLVAVVEVAKKLANVGVPVAVRAVAEVKAANMPVVPPVTPLPVPPPTQVPFTAKQPEVKLIPFAKVDEAVAEVTFKRFVWMPQANVEVAVVEVAVKYGAVREL